MKSCNLFQNLFNQLGLGVIYSEPKQITGGHLHKMFSINCESGRYAVKVLNPLVMIREDAKKNFIDSENISLIVSKNIPAIPALRFNGSAIQECDGRYYLIYDFLEARCIYDDEITSKHCEKMGSILAKIHKTDFSSLNLYDNYSSVEQTFDWDFYLEKGIEQNAKWVNILSENTKKIYLWNDRLIKGSAKLNKETVISHGDFEPKNVMWHDDKPYVIDWEAAGFVHPAYDLLENAVYWSKESDGNINETKFKAFFSSYNRKTTLPNVDWSVVADRGFVMLGWLEYSLKRSLRIECSDDDEQKMGIEHVFGTIYNLVKYDDTIPVILKWIDDIYEKK